MTIKTQSSQSSNEMGVYEKLLPPFSPSACLVPESNDAAENPSVAKPVLPASYRNQDDGTFQMCTSWSAFLVQDMQVDRLNAIHQYLWWAGLPTSARPLHRQKMLERELVYTEQTDLHLVWHESRMFIKPLPGYLLDHEFWIENICDDVELHRRACGFLLSYAWLICHPSDLEIATDAGLLPWKISWESWTAFMKDFLPNAPPRALNQRYEYGELRLNRLNTIYRLTHISEPKNLLRGYMNNSTSYRVFLYRHFAWIFSLFACVTIVQGAMQLCLASNQLQNNFAFHRAAYGFALFIIFLLLSIFVFIASLLAFLFLFNLGSTLLFHKKRRMDKTV